MNSIQLFAQSQGATGYASNVGLETYVELDLYPEEPIKYSKSVQTVEDPQSTTSAFSKSFRIPHTSPNGLFMKAVFNVNSVEFDATKKAPAYINIDGAYFTSGNIRLQSIIRNDREQKIEYEIIFMGETSTFASNVGGKFLSDLDISRLSHQKLDVNIINSWDGNLIEGNVLYPLVEWGYTYTDGVPNETTLSLYDATRSVKGFTNSANKLSMDQFKPFIKAKYLWDRIFEEAGFTYESNFLTDDLFRKIYLVSTDKDTSKVTAPNQLNWSADYGLYSYTPTTSPAFTNIFADLNVIDPSGNYTSTGITYFTAPSDGFYEVTISNMQINFTAFGTVSNKQFRMGIISKNPGTPPAPNFSFIFDAYLQGGGPNPGQVFFDPAFTTTTKTALIYAGAGTEILSVINVPSPLFNTFDIRAGTISGVLPGLIDPKGYLPSQYKQLDFIKAINDRFKLMWEPDLQNPKKFKIEPWIDWVRGGTGKDWSDKLNENFDVKIDPLFYSYPKQLNFQDSTESDIYNDTYQKEFKQTFGQINVNSEIELITGTDTITSVFAAFPIAPIGNADRFLIPHLSRINGTEVQPIQVKPRLCFYNGQVTAPYTYYLDVSPGISVTGSFDVYPLVSSFDSYPFDQSSFDLSWTNVKQFWNEDVVGFDGRTGSTCYNNYWKKWLEATYDPYSRIMTATFALDSTDITTLNFNDKIFVKDAWWLPLKITDFVLGKKQNVKVELLKLGRVGVSIGGEPSKLTRHKDLCFGATVVEACCCTGVALVTLYSDQPDLFTSGNVYLDPDGKIYPSAGYYNEGGMLIEVGPFGQILSITDCGPISCDVPDLFEITEVCWGASLCDACCCVNGVISIWADAPTLDLARNLYSEPLGGSLTPNSWYSKGGNASQVGPDGITVIQTGNCSFCNCEPIVNELVLGGWYDGADTSGIQKACCIQGSTGNIAANTYFIDSINFETATEIYVTNSADYPFGTTGQGYYFPVSLSDGEYVKTVYNGSVLTSTGCTYAEPCAGRTSTPDFWAYNSTGTNITMDFTYLTSFGGSDFYTGSSTSTGASISDNNSFNYDPNSIIKVVLDVTTPSAAGNIYYEAIYNGVTGPTGSALTSPNGTITTTPVLAGTGAWVFNFYWTL